MESLTDIAVFVQVVESSSFTAAAERLDISKSVVSKYVTRLEDHLGARLLNRTTRRLSLTEVGRVFYDRSRKGLSDIEDAQLEVSRLQGEPRGTLRINVPMSFGILHVAPALADFQLIASRLCSGCERALAGSRQRDASGTRRIASGCPRVRSSSMGISKS